MKNGFPTLFVAVFLLLPFLGQPAAAEMLTVPFEYEVSNGFAPEGNKPWAKATFDDEGTIGSVILDIDLSNLVGDEFIGRALFNLDPALDPTSLTFGPPTKIGSFADPVIVVGIDTLRAAGGQWFDLKFDFGESNSNDTEGRFGAGESMVIQITAPGLEAASFDFSSNSDDGPGPLTGAIHVQNIGAEKQSGWVADYELFPILGTVPEPGILVHLLSVAGLGLFTFGWRRYGRRKFGHGAK